jgi:reverse gyrase
MTEKNNKNTRHTKVEQVELEVAEISVDKENFSIETTTQQLEAVINNYKELNKKIHINKNKITDLQKNTIRIKENKQRIENKINNNESGEVTSPMRNTIGSSNLMKEIVDNKYLIKNKTCHAIKKHVEKIQNHITSDTKKSAGYIEPLYLSCKLLKTHVLYTQSLESTVEAFDIQRELELQQDDANELVTLLVDHFNSIKNYQPLVTTNNTEESVGLMVSVNKNDQAPLK